jgi:hypothetical protein
MHQVPDIGKNDSEPGLLNLWLSAPQRRPGEVKTSPGFFTFPAPQSEKSEIVGQDPEPV